MKKRLSTSAFARKRHSDFATDGFTIVEIIVTVALAGLFVGVFVTAAQAYQTVRLETQRKTEAYSVAQQLAVNSRGATSESLSCSTTGRQVIAENQPISFDTTAAGGVNGDEALLINPQYNLYGEYLNGCNGEMRVVVRVAYGTPNKRENVETIAL
jgi:type II secretory pathway pseudopilin PulG